MARPSLLWQDQRNLTHPQRTDGVQYKHRCHFKKQGFPLLPNINNRCKKLSWLIFAVSGSNLYPITQRSPQKAKPADSGWVSALQPYPMTIRLLEGCVQSTQVSLFHVVHTGASHWPKPRQFDFLPPWSTFGSLNWSLCTQSARLNLNWTPFSTECSAKNTLLSGTLFILTTAALVGLLQEAPSRQVGL